MATAKKLYYKIGEACKELDIQPYVLRYWETEFHFLKPDKSKSGQRVYSEEDLVVIRRIKELLYEEGYTIAGAKKNLEGEIESGELGESVAIVWTEGSEDRRAGGDRRAQPRKPSAAAAEQPSAAAAEAEQQVSLDTVASEQVETIARRIRGLRNEAQKILELVNGEHTD